MPTTVQDILDIIERIAPAQLAEEWDNVGLMIGKPSDEVRAILVGLDPDLSLLDEAVSCGANLLITHHPSIFHPLQSVHLDTPDGQFVEHAIKNEINVLSCHTNLDSTAEGVSFSLAQRLGLEDVEPLVPNPGTEHCGLGSIGKYRRNVGADEFVERLRHACSPSWMLATPNKPEVIGCAAVCGGSCSDAAPVALESGAQVFVTSEVKHSMARWAEQAGLWLIDAGHFATENQAIPYFAEKLAAETSSLSGTVNIQVSRQQGSPLQML